MFNFILYAWVKGRITEDQIGQLVDNKHLTEAQAGIILDFPKQV